MLDDKQIQLIHEPSFKLAAALLLQYGEISISDIQALPFVHSAEVAEIVAEELTRRLGAIRYQKRVSQGIMNRWEDFMCLPSGQRVLNS